MVEWPHQASGRGEAVSHLYAMVGPEAFLLAAFETGPGGAHGSSTAPPRLTAVSEPAEVGVTLPENVSLPEYHYQKWGQREGEGCGEGQTNWNRGQSHLGAGRG